VNTGTFGSYVSSGITLGLNNGDTFQLQWRMATDSSATASSPNGWWLDNVNVNGNVTVADTPEPGTSGMALLGLAGLVYGLRRRSKRVSS
jgi:MYXO-CTERM domain-containing protein